MDPNAGIAAINKSLQDHEKMLETLKDVPNLLNQMTQAMGISKTKEPRSQFSPSWGLGLSDEENDIDPNLDVVDILGDDKSETEASAKAGKLLISKS
jgi:hypothetical protein